MKNLVCFFVNNYKLTIVLTIFLSVYGGMGLKFLKSESFPNVNLAMATITTNYDGASAKDIETKITKTIEDEIRKVSGLKDVRSISQAGLSTIFVRADIDNVDVEKIMNDLQKSIDRVTKLPNDLRERPIFQEIKSEEFPVFELAIVGSNKFRERDIIADHLKEEIEDNKNVLNVRPTGFLKRSFQVFLNSDKLNLNHISIDEVQAKIQARNVDIPGGDLRDNITQNLIRIESSVKSDKELSNLLIRSNFSGQQIHLKDVADVIDSEDEAKVMTNYNGQPATLLTVNKKAGADIIDLVNSIEKKVDYFRERHKGNFKFIVYNNEAKKVKNRLNVLSSNAVTGLILVIVFLFIFLPGKVGLAAALSLPLAVLGTFGVMYSIDSNLNAITILALVIALGMMVDNSVVISENYTRLLKTKKPQDAILESIQTLWLPITATAFTTIAAFLPMLVTKGIMGEFIKFIPIIVTTALLLSLLESFFFLPMRLVGVISKKDIQQQKEQDWFQKIVYRFEKFMNKLINNKYKVFVTFNVVMVLSFLLIVKGNRFILFPAEQTEIYMARFETSIGSRLIHTEDELKKLANKVKKQMGNEIVHIVGRAGIAKAGIMDPKGKDGNNTGILIMYVNENTKLNTHHSDFIDRLKKISTTGIKKIYYEALVNGPPVGEPINATFRSNDIKSLDSFLFEITRRLQNIQGINDLNIDDVVGDDEIFINIDYVKADQLGLTVNKIGNTIRTAISGRKISDVMLNNKKVDIFLRLVETSRKNIEDLKQIKILDKMGNLVPISSFTTFKKTKGSPQIKRFDFKKAKTLTGNVDEKIITAFEANNHLKNIYKELSKDYPNISLIFGGQEQNTKESMESLSQALVLSLIGIFALLVFLFKSYLRPIIIMSTIPLGLVGFSIAFYLHDKPISFLALIGVIGLGGIIVNAGIVLISFIDNMLESNEDNLTFVEILAKASSLRLRAVLVTSLTTISGLLPTAYGIGGTDEILVPMTMSMAWGLTSGTILTIIWVPCAYAIIEDISSLTEKILSRKKITI